MIFRVNHKGILIEVYKAKKDIGKCVIVIPGLPNQPQNLIYGQELSDKNLTIFQPRYIGSWESSGEFSLKNCLKTLNETIKLVKKQVAIESYNCKKINWKCKEITIIATSFGTSIQLSLDNYKDIDKLVSIAPLTNLTKHSKNANLPEQNLESLYDFLKIGFKEAFRGFKKSDWTKFLKGNSKANPINNTTKIRNKKILLVHSNKDNTINISRTKEYYKLIKANNNVDLKLYNKCSHGKSIKKASLPYVTEWILRDE